MEYDYALTGQSKTAAEHPPSESARSQKEVHIQGYFMFLCLGEASHASL